MTKLDRASTLLPIPVALALRDIVPPPELFAFRSELHGQKHVARVMVHAFHLLHATGAADEGRRLWAAVYIHDLARTHDGRCERHGADACKRLRASPTIQAAFIRGGVTDADYDAIEIAVTTHSRGELERTDPHWRLTALLKDADGLDRVRLGDLDPQRLRHPEAREMVAFAERLFTETSYRIPAAPDYFERLWPEALRILKSCS
jgi:hypothetical protein